MNLETIILLSIFLFLISFSYFLKNNDEFPLLVFIFFAATGLNRYHSVLIGDVNWIKVSYAYSIFSLDDALALEALNLFLLGSFFLIISYIFYNKNNRSLRIKYDDDNQFYSFLLLKRNFIIGLFIFFIFINAFTNKILSEAENIAYGNSYAFLFRLAIGGLILLIYLLYKKIEFKKNFLVKSTFLFLLVFSAFLSYNPTLRFQFLSWIIALGVLILKDTPAFSKLRIYIIGSFAVLVFFSLAGVARKYDLSSLSWEESYELALERAVTTEDQNMLDGFMMVLQVYPAEL